MSETNAGDELAVVILGAGVAAAAAPFVGLAGAIFVAALVTPLLLVVLMVIEQVVADRYGPDRSSERRRL